MGCAVNYLLITTDILPPIPIFEHTLCASAAIAKNAASFILDNSV
jgi:hypothetical protein